MGSRPVWLEIAYKEMEAHVEEVLGPNSNPRIVAYYNEVSLKDCDDSVVPWCACFISACYEWAGIPSTRSASAKSYLKWGDPIDKPRDGALAVLYRGSKEGPYGHVGFYVGETKDKVMLLGGNQHNRVCILGYPKEQVLSYRWPAKEVRVSDASNSSDTYYNN